MNNSKTPKIVIGAGLAAVYAAGFAYFTLSGAHDNVISQSASTAQIAPVPPSFSDLASTESLASVEEPAVATTAIESTPNAAADAEGAASSYRSDVRSISKVVTVEPADSGDSGDSGDSADAPGDEPLSGQSTSSSAASDSEITVDVPSGIAAVVPANSIDVAPMEDVAEPAGPVPSEDEVE